MKAKEYFAKYEEDIVEEAKNGPPKTDGPAAQMLIEFASEVKQLCKVRHVRHDGGVVPIFLELNQKWNAVVNLFIKKYGETPLRRNGFYIAMKQEIPELPDLGG